MGRPKMAGNGRKSGKFPVTHGGCCRRFAGPIRAGPAVARCEISPAWSSGGGSPPRPARVHGGWLESPPLVQKLLGSQMVKNDPMGCSRFGEFFLGFWSSRWCFGG